MLVAVCAGSCDDRVDLESETIYATPGADFTARLRAPASPVSADWNPGSGLSVTQSGMITATVTAPAGGGVGLEGSITGVGEGHTKVEVLPAPGTGTLAIPHTAGERPAIVMSCDMQGNCAAAAGVGVVPQAQVNAAGTAQPYVYSEDYRVQPPVPADALPPLGPRMLDVYVEALVDDPLLPARKERATELFRLNRTGITPNYVSQVQQVFASVEVTDVAIEDCGDIPGLAGTVRVFVVDVIVSDGQYPRGLWCPAQNAILLSRCFAVTNVLAHELAHVLRVDDRWDGSGKPWALMWGAHTDEEAQARETFTLGELFRMNFSASNQAVPPLVPRQCPAQCPPPDFDFSRGK